MLKERMGETSDDKLLEGLIDQMNRDLDKKEEKAAKVDITEEVKVKNPQGRYVPQKLVAKLFKLSQGRCEYVSPLNGKRCEEKRNLQIHHALPFAVGGPTVEGNLKVLCKSHNSLASREYYGRDKWTPGNNGAKTS